MQSLAIGVVNLPPPKLPHVTRTFAILEEELVPFKEKLRIWLEDVIIAEHV